MSVVVDLTGAALVRAKREIERLEDEREDAILLLARTQCGVLRRARSLEQS